MWAWTDQVEGPSCCGQSQMSPPGLTQVILVVSNGGTLSPSFLPSFTFLSSPTADTNPTPVLSSAPHPAPPIPLLFLPVSHLTLKHKAAPKPQELDFRGIKNCLNRVRLWFTLFSGTKTTSYGKCCKICVPQQGGLWDQPPGAEQGQTRAGAECGCNVHSAIFWIR